MLGEVVDERRILERARPVPDALDAQVAQRAPDALGAGGLAGVRGQVESGCSRNTDS